MVRHLNGVTFINVGTPRHLHTPGFALLSSESNEVQFYDLTPNAIELEGCHLAGRRRLINHYDALKDLAKVDVAGSSPVSRSRKLLC
jgi:hypothetical protein